MNTLCDIRALLCREDLKELSRVPHGGLQRDFDRIPGTFVTSSAGTPPHPTVLPTMGAIGCPIPDYSRNSSVVRCVVGGYRVHATMLNSRASTWQKCEAIRKRALIAGPQTGVSLNSRPDGDTERYHDGLLSKNPLCHSLCGGFLSSNRFKSKIGSN